MERRPDIAEVEMSPFGDLIDLLVEEARRSVQGNETTRERIEGCLAGLEKCAEMRDLSVVEFDFELAQMQEVTKAMKSRPRESEQARKDYWHQRCATAQVEYCYEILRVAHRARYGQLPEDGRKYLLARSTYRYNILAMKLELGLDGANPLED